jgi:nucleoside-diphosphate-sugar epimerase
MHVFLTGATGYLGAAVAGALRRAGHEVSGLARSPDAEAKLRSAGVRPVSGSLHDLPALAGAAGAAEGVIHTANTNAPDAGTADAAAVSAMLSALAGSGKPFVYTSGVWVYGDTRGAVVDEKTSLKPAPMVAWRPAVEEAVLGSVARGVRAIVIRPGLVYGHGGGIPAMLVRSARDSGAARFVGDGRNHWPVVAVDDLAALYVLALERAQAGTVLVAVTESQPVTDIARAASEGAGAGGRTTSWPLVEACQSLGPLADALAFDQRASGAQARALGWQPRAAGILETLRSGQ